MRYFPAFFDLEGQPALIVGGGEVALRKLCLLERAGAAITVVAREAAPEIAARAARGAIALLGREFAAAYAGIPLTHRDHAHGVSFVTAHDGGAEPDWRALAMPGQTAVFYMGLACIERTTAKLIAHGAPPDRPAAVIAQGTSAAQKVVVATLATMHGEILRAGPLSPALLLVGDVVALQSKLGWLHNDGIAELSASV